jgi:hypothetical protein
MGYYEWIEQGVEAGYIQIPMCGMHDTPISEEEYDEEHCVPIARLLPPDNTFPHDALWSKVASHP